MVLQSLLQTVSLVIADSFKTPPKKYTHIHTHTYTYTHAYHMTSEKVLSVSVGMLKCRLMLHLTFVLMLLLVLMMMLIVMLSWVSGDGDCHFFRLIDFLSACPGAMSKASTRPSQNAPAKAPTVENHRGEGDSLQQALRRHSFG